MKQLIAISSILLTSLFNANGQNCTSDRYLSNIFQSSVSQDVVYGNSPALTTVYVAENVTVNQEMTMDIFFPVGDNLQQRPAVMLAYGGGYLVGSKEDEDVWTTCDSLAKKGYVTASINYRMNMNVSSSSSAVRAIYRAAQDYSSALRFLKENATTYGIDTNYIFVGGVSAGGFSAMHMVFLDENERPAETFQSGILGADPDLGCISCAGNNYNHTNKVRGIINLWGALMDTSYIQQDELVPMTLFHGTDDLIVPSDYGFPFTALFLMPEVFGSVNIAERVNNLGGNAELNLFPGVGHNIWGVNVDNVLVGGPTEYWSPITDSIVSFLYENIRPDEPVLSIADTVCLNDTVSIEILNFPPNGRACWLIEEGIIVSASQDSSQLFVVWTTAGSYNVTVSVVNHLGAVSPLFSAQTVVNPTPVNFISAYDNTIFTGNPFPTYQWYLDGEAIDGANLSTYWANSTGVYTLQVTDRFGCSSISEGVLMVGTEEIENSVITPSFVAVYDIYGREIASYSFNTWQRASNLNLKGIFVVAYLNINHKLMYWKKQILTNL